jgi:membrane-associated phospholipid phosphatase
VLLQSIDDRAAVWIATHRFARLNDIFVWLGYLDKVGAVWVVLAIFVGVTLRLGVISTATLTLLTGAATFAADSACFGLKDVVERTRPFVAHPQIDPLYVVHSSSFPAGHAATAFAGATLLSYIAPRGAPGFLLLAAAIGYSRVYVGVHYPSDVLAGALVGALIGIIGIGVWCWIRGSNTRLGEALTEV